MTDRQTDRRTDRITTSKTALAYACAVKTKVFRQTKSALWCIRWMNGLNAMDT